MVWYRLSSIWESQMGLSVLGIRSFLLLDIFCRHRHVYLTHMYWVARAILGSIWQEICASKTFSRKTFDVPHRTYSVLDPVITQWDTSIYFRVIQNVYFCIIPFISRPTKTLFLGITSRILCFMYIPYELLSLSNEYQSLIVLVFFLH